MKVYFGTTNKGKLSEARNILQIEIEETPLEIDEIQSLDPVKVAVRKAQDYFVKLKKPVLIEDSSLVFHALGSLPGTYISGFMEALGNNGLVKILDGYTDRKATALTTLAFCNSPDKVEIFTGEVKGSIARKPLGKNGFGWDQIFIPAGRKKTFAQMTEKDKNHISMRAQVLHKFKLWLKQNPPIA